MSNKIDFQKAWFAANYIYQPLNDSGKRVAEVIGGRVAFNINEVDEHYRWKNTCAVRLSYILNESGLKVPAIPKKNSVWLRWFTILLSSKGFKRIFNIAHWQT